MTSSSEIKMAPLILAPLPLCAMMACACLSTWARKLSLNHTNMDSSAHLTYLRSPLLPDPLRIHIIWCPTADEDTRLIIIGTGRTRQTKISTWPTIGHRMSQNITRICVNIHLIILRRSTVDVHLRRRYCIPLWYYQIRGSLLNPAWHLYIRRPLQDPGTQESLRVVLGRGHQIIPDHRPPLIRAI